MINLLSFCRRQVKFKQLDDFMSPIVNPLEVNYACMHEKTSSDHTQHYVTLKYSSLFYRLKDKQ